jgi:hypothetical protein
MKYLSSDRDGSPSFDGVQVENVKPLKPRSQLSQLSEDAGGPIEKGYSTLKANGGYSKYPDRKLDVLGSNT